VVRRIIETRFSQLDEFGVRFMRAVSRRGLAVKILMSILSFNIYQMMRGSLMGMGINNERDNYGVSNIKKRISNIQVFDLIRVNIKNHDRPSNSKYAV
jgi:hypothetical protein